jgi:hypothetical protein
MKREDSHPREKHVLRVKLVVFFVISTRNYKGGSGGHDGEEILKNITFCQWSIPAEFHN